MTAVIRTGVSQARGGGVAGYSLRTQCGENKVYGLQFEAEGLDTLTVKTYRSWAAPCFIHKLLCLDTFSVSVRIHVLMIYSCMMPQYMVHCTWCPYTVPQYMHRIHQEDTTCITYTVRH